MDFYALFDALLVQHLNRASSDHSPLLLTGRMSSLEGPLSFQFLEAWLTHNDFYDFVRHSLNSYPTVGGMRGWYNKLQ